MLLIAFTTFCSYGSGVLIEKYHTKRTVQKTISAANIVLNLLILGIFKYYNFFAENLAVLLKGIGLTPDWPTLNVILPVGISFYTFQALSYTIDVYRGNIKPTRDIVAFFAFISFFPQLVAGPIERATNLLPQFLKSRVFDYKKAVDGCRQILWGFFKKVVVADHCGTIVEQIWENYQSENSLSLILGGVLFSFQIYCDFSGYSDIAIGTARLFGIHLMRNFNYPYFSRSIPEFWRRWHISLTTWFRDYIYFPLGGSRCEKWKVIRNTIIVFGVSGLWHGANWTFICWGLYLAALFVPYLLFGIKTKYEKDVAEGRFLPSLKEMVQMFITFCCIVVGWIIFRANDISQAIDYLCHIITNADVSKTVDGEAWLLLCAFLFFIEWLQRRKQHALAFPSEGLGSHFIVHWCVYIVLSVWIIYMSGDKSDFIYFQF